jgi:hypothetical protein
VRWGIVLGGSRYRSGFLHKFCIGWFSCFNKGSSVESRESLSLHFQFSARKSNHLPLVALSFNLKPCSKYVRDS